MMPASPGGAIPAGSAFSSHRIIHEDSRLKHDDLISRIPASQGLPTFRNRVFSLLGHIRASCSLIPAPTFLVPGIFSVE
jgi:hypothetical protein